MRRTYGLVYRIREVRVDVRAVEVGGVLHRVRRVRSFPNTLTLCFEVESGHSVYLRFPLIECFEATRCSVELWCGVSIEPPPRSQDERPPAEDVSVPAYDRCAPSCPEHFSSW